MKRRSIIAALACAAALPALAADWPQKPITMIVPFPAGGSTDALARLVAQQLSEKLGQQVVVDNRPGAGGNLGTALVAKAQPDGQTIALSTSGPLANNKFLYKSLPYDPQKDLTPIVSIGAIPVALAVPAASKIHTLEDFLKAARTQPGKLSIANPGNGTIGHLSAELMQSQAAVKALSVAYRGDSPAINDTLGSVVDAVSMPITALIPQIQSGRLKGIAVMSRQRIANLPNTPTGLEQDFDAEASVWMAIVGPKGLPEPVVSRLNREVNAILAAPQTRSKLAQFGAVALGGSAQQLKNLMASDSEKWKKVIQDAQITLD